MNRHITKSTAKALGISSDVRSYHNAKVREYQKAQKVIRLSEVPGSSIAPAGSIFGVVFLMLFIVNFFYSATSNETPFSFTTLLYAFQEAPQIPIDWIKKFASLQITSDWTVAFNWLRDFLNNYVMKIITAGLFLCTGIVQLITYSVYFIGILFGAGVGV